MSNSRYDTQSLWQQDRDHAIHPHALLPDFEKEGSLIMARGEGAYVFDTEGRRYLDGIAGLWCVNVGYGQESVVQAAAEQQEQKPPADTAAPGSPVQPPAQELVDTRDRSGSKELSVTASEYVFNAPATTASCV